MVFGACYIMIYKDEYVQSAGKLFIFYVNKLLIFAENDDVMADKIFCKTEVDIFLVRVFTIQYNTIFFNLKTESLATTSVLQKIVSAITSSVSAKMSNLFT